jgi:CBS domain-containing protein
MFLFVSGATKTIQKYKNNPNLGCLLTPISGNSQASMCGLPWAADNAAFSGFDETKFIRMLEKIRGTNPKFVTAPDVVGDAKKTLELFNYWHPIIKSYNLPIALVLQNGQEHLPVPWDKLDAIFIGGDTEWKLGEHARKFIKKAKALGKWVHMGRVNTFNRLRYAQDIGCDSVDGSGFSRFPDTLIPNALKLLGVNQIVFDIV